MNPRWFLNNTVEVLQLCDWSQKRKDKSNYIDFGWLGHYQEYIRTVEVSLGGFTIYISKVHRINSVTPDDALMEIYRSSIAFNVTKTA